MNKEIEEAKHELKGIANNEFVPPELSDIDAKILLSYIEQLEKENKKLKQWDKNKDTRNSRQRIANALLMKKNKQLEKRNKQLYEGFMATQEELTDYATENEQLKHNRDKAIEYVESHFIFNDKTGECCQTHTFDKDNAKKLYDILRMLGEEE